MERRQGFPVKCLCVFVFVPKGYFYLEVSSLTSSHSKFKVHDKMQSEPFKTIGLI